MTDRLEAIWARYANIAGVFDKRPDFRFDPEFYVATYGEGTITDAQGHYDTQGRAEGLATSFYAHLARTDPNIDEVIARLVRDPELSEAIAAGVKDATHLACELIRLGAPVDSQISDFSNDAYLRHHTDVAATGLNPLSHWLQYGAREGRHQPLADIRKQQLEGRRPFRPELRTCLIAVHEMSRTGAPVVGRDLLREAAQTHNVIIASLRTGELLDDFLEYACDVVISPTPQNAFAHYSGPAFEQIDFAILNSIECAQFVAPLVARDIPFAAYLHEYATYSFPLWTSLWLTLFTDLIVFSSEHVRDSWRGRLADIEFDVERDSCILPQRQAIFTPVAETARQSSRDKLGAQLGCDLQGKRIICGAGHVQWRKGTDIFVMAAQICRSKDPDTVFVWIGDGRDAEDIGFGAWFEHHLAEAGHGVPGSNLYFLPAGPLYFDVLRAADAMFLSSRLDPLPNVVFDALSHGCRIVCFDGATGFCDATYQSSDSFQRVEYGNPAAAAEALLALPKTPTTEIEPLALEAPRIFETIRDRLMTHLSERDHFVIGSPQIDIPVLYSTSDDDRGLRVKEREKLLSYGRRRLWRSMEEAQAVLKASNNWAHALCQVAPYTTVDQTTLPDFNLHVHAFYTDDLAEDLGHYRAFCKANRIVLTTDTARKVEEIIRVLDDLGIEGEVRQVPNRGRDILPFLALCDDGEDNDIWCHVHQKQSLTSTTGGDIWRRFLLNILLGNGEAMSNALLHIAAPETGLVAPFDPHFVPWNASRRLLPQFEGRLRGPFPENPLVFPVGNMFWARQSVVRRMRDLFGTNYPWPNEPIANDGTEYHLIERLWSTVAADCDLGSVFLHKPDERRV